MDKAWRNDGYAKVTGRAKYTDDLKFHGMLHGVPVYPRTKIHCKITGLSGLEEAGKIPGVVRIITADDIPGKKMWGYISQDYALLAHDKIRCEGDVIALVIGETREAALEGAAKIDVEGVDLPLVTDPEEALKNEVLIHEGKGTNVINAHHIRRGKDIEQALEECDVILDRIYSTGHVEHAYLEPESALCRLRDDGVMEVRGSMQHPFSTRRFTANLLGWPLSRVEIIGTAMGGGFGGKDDTAAIVCARAALAALLCSRPVKITYTREWSMRESYKRHPYRMKYRIGLKDGRLHAVKADMVADGGAYTSATPWVTWRSTVQCCGPYSVPNVFCDVTGVHTNNVFTGAFRGFGAPQVNFAVEQWIEECARELGKDPIAFRRDNMLRQDGETVTGQKLDNHRVTLEEVLDKALEISGYEEKRKRNGRLLEDGTRYGVGLAISYRGCSLGAEGMDFCSAIINCQFDGSILLETGIHENGQGAETTMVMLLADKLGVSRERIRYAKPSTSHIPDGGTTVASRGTLMGGGAVVNGVKNLKAIIAESLSDSLECLPGEVRIHDDRVWGKTEDISLSWEEAMHRMFLNSDYPYAFGSFQAPKVTWDEETGRGRAYFTWGYHCQIAETAVDEKSGKVKLLHAYAVHDAGRAINRQGLEGQIHGGFAQGYGMALSEDLAVQNGRTGHLSLNKYRIPRSTDLCDMETATIEYDDPNSPGGGKGIGEPALEIAAACTANAVAAATGRRCSSYPMKIKQEES